MKTFILMNEKTAEIGIGIPISFYHEDIEIEDFRHYAISIVAEVNGPDGWLVVAEEGQPYFYVDRKLFERSDVKIMMEL